MAQPLSFPAPRRKAKRIKDWQPLDNRVIPMTPEQSYDSTSLSREWNDEVFIKQATSAPYCARRPACAHGTCCYPIACDTQTVQPPTDGK